jgi:hypothetical protein
LELQEKYAILGGSAQFIGANSTNVNGVVWNPPSPTHHHQVKFFASLAI